MKKSIIAILFLFFLVFGSISAIANDQITTEEGYVYRTTDTTLLNLLEARKNLGPEILKQGFSEKYRDMKISQLFGLSAPTANMLKYDVTHYLINIALNFSAHSIQSQVTITGRATADALSTVDLTFKDAYTIDNVSVNGQPATYAQSGELFTVYLLSPIDSGQTFQIEVEYHGYPYYSGTPQSNTGGGLSYASQYTGNPICQTECEPFGARNWFPCKDFPFDKADSVDLYVTHPTGMTTSGNGLLQSITNNGNGTSTTHWKTRYPITTYVIHFVTTYQNLYEQSWEYAPGDTMPVVVYAYDGYPQAVNNYLTYTIPGLQIQSELFGLYPFVEEKYGNSLYDLWGMENQTMTVLVPSIAVEWIIIHEMAHHWWGDLITCHDFHDIWLNEGFGTYSEALYFEYLYGTDYYHDYIQTQSCLNSGSVYVEDLDNDYIFSPTTTYNKGSRVLHMLRGVVGDSAMFQILRNYESDPELRYSYASTSDFQAHAEAVYGSSLEWFFNQWIYQPGNPHYQYGWANSYDSAKNQDQLLLSISQMQNGDGSEYPLFTMPVQIKIFYGTSDTTLTVMNNEWAQGYPLDIPAPADSVKFDPDHWILSTVKQTELSLTSITESYDTAYLGQNYYLEFKAMGGMPPYTWQKVGGQFPYGLVFHGGTPSYLDGVPTYLADFAFQMAVYDSSVPTKADTTWIHVLVTEPEGYLCGDANSDGEVNISDAVYIINYVFLGGSAPNPMQSGDVNCDSSVNVSDAVYIINYIFINGSAPCDC